MDVARLSEPTGQGLIADDLVRTVAMQDECAIVISEADAVMAAMLDRVRDELLHRRVRCVRVSMSPRSGLSLHGLMAQIMGRPESHALTDGELKAGFTALAEPGAGYDRVALLIDGAHSLQLPALRYIQLACQSGPKLRVVLAGRPALETLLARHEFGALDQRIRRRFEPASSSLTGLAAPAAGGRKRRAPPRWLTSLNTGLGALASSALIVSLALWVLPVGRPPDLPASPPPVPAGDAGEHAASASEAPTAPLTTWTERPVNAPEATKAPVSGTDPVPTPVQANASEAPAPSADPVPTPVRPVHEVAPVAASNVPPAEPPLVPDQPPRLDPPPAETVPEIHIADLGSESASLRRIEPAATTDHQPDPAASSLAVSDLAAPRRPSPAQPPPQPVRHVATVAKQAVAPDESEEGRRCRDIVLNAQLGRTPSHADMLFLQNGCRAR